MVEVLSGGGSGGREKVVRDRRQPIDCLSKTYRHANAPLKESEPEAGGDLGLEVAAGESYTDAAARSAVT